MSKRILYIGLSIIVVIITLAIFFILQKNSIKYIDIILNNVGKSKFTGESIYTCYDFETTCGMQLVKDNKGYYSVYIDIFSHKEHVIRFDLDGELIDAFGSIDFHGSNFSFDGSISKEFFRYYQYFIIKKNNNKHLCCYKSVGLAIINDNKISGLNVTSTQVYKINADVSKIVSYEGVCIDEEPYIFCQSPDKMHLFCYDSNGNRILEYRFDTPTIVSGSNSNSRNRKYSINLTCFDGRFITILGTDLSKIEVVNKNDTKETVDINRCAIDGKNNNIVDFFMRDNYSICISNGKKIFIYDNECKKIVTEKVLQMTGKSINGRYLNTSDGLYLYGVNHEYVYDRFTEESRIKNIDTKVIKVFENNLNRKQICYNFGFNYTNDIFILYNNDGTYNIKIIRANKNNIKYILTSQKLSDPFVTCNIDPEFLTVYTTKNKYNIHMMQIEQYCRY